MRNLVAVVQEQRSWISNHVIIILGIIMSFYKPEAIAQL